MALVNEKDTTTVTKKFGLALYVVFEGNVNAIEQFTKISSIMTDRGFSLELPDVGETRPYGAEDKGVKITRIDEENCAVELI